MFIYLCRALVTFGVNALFGRRRPISGDSLWSGDWNPQNARDLMEYTVLKGYKIDSYEFGKTHYEARIYGFLVPIICY